MERFQSSWFFISMMLGNSLLKDCSDCPSNLPKYSSGSICNMALVTNHISFALAMNPADSISSLLLVCEIISSHSVFHLDNARCIDIDICWIVRLAIAENITWCSPGKKISLWANTRKDFHRRKSRTRNDDEESENPSASEDQVVRFIPSLIHKKIYSLTEGRQTRDIRNWWRFIPRELHFIAGEICGWFKNCRYGRNSWRNHEFRVQQEDPMSSSISKSAVDGKPTTQGQVWMLAYLNLDSNWASQLDPSEAFERHSCLVLNSEIDRAACSSTGSRWYLTRRRTWGSLRPICNCNRMMTAFNTS